MMSDYLLKNGKVLLFQQNEDKIDIAIKEKEILIQQGKIAKIENKIQENQYPNAEILDATHCVIMPGLINTHAHIPMSLFRESTEGCKLYDWLENKIWPQEDKLTNEDVYYASMLSFIEMISTGTTCINDQYFLQDAIRKAAEDMGVRAVLTRTVIGEIYNFLRKM